MDMLYRYAKAIVLFLLLIYLSCCGGSGSGSSYSSSSNIVEGTALAGVPIAGQVWLKDAEGTILNESPVVIAEDGSYKFNVEGLNPPFYLYAAGVAGGRSYELYSLTFNTGTANINPIIDLAFRATFQSRAKEVFERPQDQNINEDKFADSLQAVIAILRLLINEFGAEGKDPLTSHIEADHSGLDGVFDSIRISINEETKEVTLTSIIDSEFLTATYLDKLHDTTPVNEEKADEVEKEITKIKEVIAFVRDYHSEKPLRSSLSDYFADNYLNNGFDKNSEIDRIYWPFSGDDLPEKLDHFSIDKIKYDGTYAISFKSYDNDGVQTQHSVSVKKDGNQWMFVGNQYLSTIDVSVFNFMYPSFLSRSTVPLTQPSVTTDDIYASPNYDTWYWDSYDSNDDGLTENYGDAVYHAGIDFGITDSADQGFEMVVVDGDGLADSVKYIHIPGLVGDFLTLNPNGYGRGYLFRDSEIEALPDNNLVYTFKIYDSYDEDTYAPIGEPIEVRTVVVPKPPLTRAETWAEGSSYYPEITNLPENLEYLPLETDSQSDASGDSLLYTGSYPDTSDLIFGDEIRINFTYPENLSVLKFDISISMQLIEEQYSTILGVSGDNVIYWNSVYSIQEQEQVLPSSSITAIFPKTETDDVVWMQNLHSIEISAQDNFNRNFSSFYSYPAHVGGGLTR